eukprot:CCRYP_010090-RA/>CCRYP_010090-RA protein AED:0.37 eAED:0.37 QI:0/-1/0/1/-1/1/1/0/970
MQDITPKGTYLPHSYYAEGDGEGNECILIPSWAGGLFPSSGDEVAVVDSFKSSDTALPKRPRRHYNESKKTNDRIKSRHGNLERLVWDEIRQCDVCACSVVWNPSASHRYFGSSNEDETKPRDSSIVYSLPYFIDHHIQSESALPCSFCCRAYESRDANNRRPYSWCGTLFCSKECQSKGENNSFAVESPNGTSHGHHKSMLSQFRTPKQFFCRNRVLLQVESKHNEQSSELMQEVLESLNALEQRLRSLSRADRSDIDSRMQSIGMEECALIIATLICFSCPSLVDELLRLSSKIDYVNQAGDNETSANENEHGGGIDLEPSEEGLVEEMWVMTRSHWSLMQSIHQTIPKNEGRRNSSNESGSNEQSEHRGDLSTADGSQLNNIPQSDETFPSYYAFAQMYAFIKRRCVVRVSPASHPLVAYATKTLISSEKMTDCDRKVALDAMQVSFEETGLNSDTFCCSAENDNFDIRSRISLWRRVTHFAHLLSTNSHDQADKEDQKQLHSWIRKSYYAFSPLSWSRLKHSCVPTMLMAMNDSICKMSSNKNGTQKRKNLSWLALHDIPIGEASVSKIDDLDTDVKSRREELKRLMGSGFVCTCERCQYEYDRNHDTADEQTRNLTPRQLKRLGDLAMQQGRFEDATHIYQAILDVDPCNADAFHAKAASLLGRASSVDYEKLGHCQGYFLEAQFLWKQAASNDIFAKHPDICVQLEKQRAFGTIRDLQCNQDIKGQNQLRFQAPSTEPLEYDFSSYLKGKVYITNDSTPIISSSECQNVIQVAENYAERKGWTTSRHYAVPTTDIPLHELKELREWFYNLWTGRVRPLLRIQFKLTASSSKPRDIFIHDAFVVRYDADGGQRNLPPHYDESTHSFVIALNTNFAGGGTYIHSLGKAIKPGVAGGMVSFCGGECLHSGDTVVTGVRYIIVAFCYVDVINRTRDEKTCDRPTTNSVSDQYAQRTGTSKPFSFGFAL